MKRETEKGSAMGGTQVKRRRGREDGSSRGGGQKEMERLIRGKDE